MIHRFHVCTFSRLAAVLFTFLMLVAATNALSENPDLFIYPARGQDQAQQSKDRYECDRWAVNQTGFDPSKPTTASNARTSAEYQPSQPHVARGAARGATVGAIGGAITGDSGKGAAAGAAMGGAVGAFRRRDERRQQAAARTTEDPKLVSGRAAYNRALAACLTGRGYSVH